MGELRSGCLVCGAALRYGAAERVTCALCGAAAESPARCAAGHFVCDPCHSGSAKDVVERACLATASADPLEIARSLMRHPRLALHGPEHHFLVPAALLAAEANARGVRADLARRLSEARRRSDAVAGGFCGFQGACGAGIGAGIFVSVATGATPLADEPWRLANAATARALEIISRAGGPRCCKRTTGLALLAAARFARERLGVRLPTSSAPCEWTDANRECIEARCPFFPRAARSGREAGQPGGRTGGAAAPCREPHPPVPARTLRGEDEGPLVFPEARMAPSASTHLDLSQQELRIMVQSLTHCIATCQTHAKKADAPCEDCDAARALKGKLEAQLAS